MTDFLFKHDIDFHINKVIQTNDMTSYQRQNIWTLTDKKENKYFPRFTFLKILKKICSTFACANALADAPAVKRAAINIIILP